MHPWLRRMYAPVVVEASIPASRPDVYAVLADPATYPDWLVGAHHVRAIDPDFPEPGTTFEHSVGPVEPLTIDDTTESIDAEPSRFLALQVHAGLFHARVEFRLAPMADGGTHVAFREQPTGWCWMITPVLRHSLAARNRKSLEQLRARWTSYSSRTGASAASVKSMTESSPP